MSLTRTVLAAVHTPRPDDAATDTELLGRFAEGGGAGEDSETAFAELVRRHARLVWGVCRRTLGHVQDAEDAFQATFLVLARNPHKPRRSGTAAAFLFGVARRVALKMRTRAANRPAHPPATEPGTAPDPLATAAIRELQAILDEEIGRLPDAYRTAFLLCVVEGRSRAAAAAELGVAEGTLSGRLARARLLLRDRLAKRGVQLAAALAVTDLAASAAPPGLVRAAVAAGVTGRPVPALAALAGGVRVRLLLGTAAGLVVCVAVAAGLATVDPPQSNDPPPTAKATERPAVLDVRGDALPAGAVARIGSDRWRHEGEAESVAFAPDGKSLAVLSKIEGVISFFETATGKRTRRLSAPDGSAAPCVVAFSPDGAVFACQTGDGSVHLWDARTGKLVRTLKPPGGQDSPGNPRSVAFSPDGKLLAVSGGADLAIVWEVASGKAAVVVTGHRHSNPPMVFSRDGKILCLTGGDRQVQLFNAETGKFLRGFEPGHAAFSLAVSPDGKRIAAGGRDRVTVSDFESGKELARLEAKMGAALNLAFTPDGKTLASGGEDAKVRVWDVATRKERRVLDSRGWIGRSMALTADGKTAAMGTVYNVVRVWDVDSGKELSEQPDGHDAPVHAVAYSPDGRLLATGGANQQVRVWDAATNRQVGLIRGSAAHVSFSPDGRRLATAWEWGDRVRVWDVGRGEELLKLVPAAVERCPCAAFTPDGTSVVTASWRKGDENFGKTVLQTWDGATGKPLRELVLGDLQPHALAVSPDGKWAAAGGNAGNGSGPGPSLRLCDLVRDRERPVRRGDTSYVVSVAFSPDGRLLAAGSIDLHTRLFEVATGREVLTLSGHERTVAAVAFAPGGRVLAAADGGPGSRYRKENPGPRTIRFWDVGTGRELARLGGHGSDVTSLAFTPDGKRLAAGLHNGTALVWETPAAARQLAATVGRKLGPKEMAALWADLAGDDARVAHEAVRILAGSPEQSVPFLADALKPAGKIDAAKVRRRIAELGDDEFAVRVAASRELAAWGEDVEPALLETRAGQPSPEVARRVGALLTALGNAPPPVRRRELRGVWVLELIGTTAAEKVLVELAAGDQDARLTREAKAARSRTLPPDRR